MTHTLDEVLRERQRQQQQEPKQPPYVKTIVPLLRTQFGLGENPETRLALYRHIRDAIDRHGKPAYDLLRDLVTRSARANHPDRWFCKVCPIEFERRNLWL